MGYHMGREGADWQRKYVYECQGQFILSLQANLRKNMSKIPQREKLLCSQSLGLMYQKNICISSWSLHDLPICGTSFIPVVYKVHSLIQYSPRFIINEHYRYEPRAMFEFKSGLPVYYSTFQKITLDMDIFQIAGLTQMHIGYTSLNFP